MEITPYDYFGKMVRIIIDKKGDPWLVASDLCLSLGLSNATESIRSLDSDEKSTLRISEGGPKRNIINESGLYRLLSRSNKKRAKKFQRWLFHDVLPAIRKTGFYSTGPQAPKTRIEAVEQLLVELKKNKKLTYKVKVLEPKARVYDLIASSKGLVCISDCANILQIPPHKFSADLIRDDYCHKRRGKHVAYVQYRNLGWFEMKLVHARDGSGHSYRQTFITPLGVAKFREIYNPKQAQRRLFA